MRCVNRISPSDDGYIWNRFNQTKNGFSPVSLTDIEAAGFTAVLKVESITKLPVMELNAVQATKSRPKNRAKGTGFGEATDKQVDVTEVTINRLQFLDAGVGNEAGQIMPVVDLNAGTIFKIVNIGGNTVFTTAIDINSWQINNLWIFRIKVEEI